MLIILKLRYGRLLLNRMFFAKRINPNNINHLTGGNTMKVKSLYLIVAAVLLFVSCKVEQSEPSIEGTWRLVTGKYVTVDTVIEYPRTAVAEHMKIISDNHFTTVWQDNNENDDITAGYNGGTYTFENGIYSESHPFFSIETRRGNVEHFAVTVTKDRLFMVPCNADGTPNKYGNYEEWVRLK